MQKYGFLIFSVIGGLWLTNCQQQTVQREKSVQEIIGASKLDNASIVRNPVSADVPEDTVNVAKLAFEESFYNFGEVNEGEVVTHSFQFKNVGKMPLVIADARSTCGCTVPEWPKDPIPPGQSGTIEVRFNTAGKKKHQRKPIYITANTYPARNEVYLEGQVIPKEPTSKIATNK